MDRLVDDKAIKIDEAIKRSTTNCEFDFCCLSGVKACLCEAKGSIGHNLLEVTPKYGSNCRYCLSLGKAFFCLCPTRNEIYNRYGI